MKKLAMHLTYLAIFLTVTSANASEKLDLPAGCQAILQHELKKLDMDKDFLITENKISNSFLQAEKKEVANLIARLQQNIRDHELRLQVAAKDYSPKQVSQYNRALRALEKLRNDNRDVSLFTRQRRFKRVLEEKLATFTYVEDREFTQLAIARTQKDLELLGKNSNVKHYLALEHQIQKLDPENNSPAMIRQIIWDAKIRLADYQKRETELTAKIAAEKGPARQNIRMIRKADRPAFDQIAALERQISELISRDDKLQSDIATLAMLANRETAFYLYGLDRAPALREERKQIKAEIQRIDLEQRKLRQSYANVDLIYSGSEQTFRMRITPRSKKSLGGEPIANTHELVLNGECKLEKILYSIGPEYMPYTQVDSEFCAGRKTKLDLCEEYKPFFKNGIPVASSPESSKTEAPAQDPGK